MATFAQRQSRQFAPYVPDVNQEVYASALARKDQEYQVGAQRVEAYRNSIAGIPVAFEHERKYLQGKANAITSQINEMVNTDWSDQRLVTGIANQVSSISNDPYVQTAIGNASRKRMQDSNLQEDTKISKGKNDVNKRDYFENLQSFATNAKVGDEFGASYFNYQDVVGEFEKYYKDKHPNSRINIQYAGYHYGPDGTTILNQRDKNGNPIPDRQLSMSTYDAKIDKWKELTPTEVQEDMEGFIKLNPNYGKQLDLNGKYSNEGLQPEQVVEKSRQVYGSILNTANRELDMVNKHLGLLAADDPQRQDWIKRKTFIENKISTASNYLDPNVNARQMQLLSANPELMGQFRKQMYMEDFYNTISKRYAFQEMTDSDLKGESPFRKQLDVKKFDFDVKKFETDTKFKEADLDIKRQRLALEKEKQEFREMAASAKQRAAQTPRNASEYGGDTKSIKKDDWQNFNEQAQDKALFIKDQKDKYIFDIWSRTHPELFDGTVPVNEAAKNTLDSLYEAKQQAYKNGGKDDQGNVVELDRLDRNHFNSVTNAQRVYDGMKGKMNEGEDAWKRKLQQLVTTDEDVKDYVKKSISNPAVSNKVANATIVFDRLVDMYNKEGINKSTSDRGSKLANQYGFRTFEEVESYVNNHRDLVDAYRKVEVKEKDFKSEYIKANNYLINKQLIPWVNPKNNKSDESILQAAIPLLHGQEAKLIDTKNVTSVGYVQDPGTGEYSLVLKDAAGKEEAFPIAKQEAASHGFIDLQTEDQLSQLLRINRNQSGTFSSTYTTNKAETPHTYSDALYLSNKDFNGKPHEVKYHVVEQGGTYYLEFWAKDLNDKTDNGHIVRDKAGNKVESQSNSLTDIRNALSNYANTGSTKAAAYMPSLEDEEEGSDIENNTNRNSQ